MPNFPVTASSDLVELPPDLLLDKNHPDNHEYFKQDRRIKQLIVMQYGMCRAPHVEIAKLHVKGHTNQDIADIRSCHPATVGHVLKRKDIRELILYLRHQQALHQGPTIALKKRILYEITVDNQGVDPRVSIAAISELNKMDGVGKEKNDTNVNIQINQTLFPKGTLDV